MPTFDDVRSISLALPEVEEHVTWGTDVNFRVRNKMFVIGGDEGDHVSIKSNLTTQADLIDLDPETFASAAYVVAHSACTSGVSRLRISRSGSDACPVTLSCPTIENHDPSIDQPDHAPSVMSGSRSSALA